MTLLTIVQRHCQVNALSVPAGVISSNDTTIQQLLGLLNNLVEEIADESQFQGFTRQALFNFVAAEDQGSIYDLADEGFLWMHNETFYDRTLRRPVYGPVSDSQWQALKAIPNPGPWYKYRIRENNLLINPVPTAPLSQVAFEYASSYGVKSASGTYKALFTADDDTYTLEEKILRVGLQWKWKHQKGLPYQKDEEDYYKILNNAIARDGTKRQFDAACNIPINLDPGIFVPSGNWPVSN